VKAGDKQRLKMEATCSSEAYVEFQRTRRHYSPFYISSFECLCVSYGYFFSWCYIDLLDRLCGLVVRVPGYRTEMYCDSCEVRTEFICYVGESRPPLWSSGQSSWLQIQRSGFDSLRYQIFWGVVCPERDPLSLVSTIEELLLRRNSGSGLENREYGHRDPSRWPRCTLRPQKLSLTPPTSGGRSVGVVRSWTQAAEFFF
jgi:hypothetical protein